MNAPKNPKIQRPPFEKWYPYVLFVFVGYCIADVGLLAYRDLLLPSGSQPSRPSRSLDMPTPPRGNYNTITTRNVFSPEGIIPEALRLEGSPGKKDAPPVLSSLPLNLVGTMVHSNPEKSIAAIEVKSKSMVISVTPGRDIENMVTIENIERQRVVFRNLNTGLLEYIEMKKDGKVAFGASGPGKSSNEIVKVGENNFALKRADLLKYTNDLPSILMQARAVPNRVPGTGEINGFRLLDMQPGSVYEQLGLQRMDVIQSVNGTLVDSPAKAMELYQALKTESKIALTIERNGKKETLNFNIQN